jgi:putative sugar O-methyltransferase
MAGPARFRNYKMDALLNHMLEDMENAPALYKPTNFWSSGVAAIIRDIEKFGVSTFGSHPSSLHWCVPTYAAAKYIKHKRLIHAAHKILASCPAAGKLSALILKELRGYERALSDFKVVAAHKSASFLPLDTLSGNPCGQRSEQFVFQGNRYSKSFFNYLRGLCFLGQKVDAGKIETVIEIGGGYGTLGEIFLKSDARKYLYIDIDIPPVAYVATYYLQQVFGVEGILSYSQSRFMDSIDLSEIARTYKAAILCPWQIPLIRGTGDLFVNFMSFQEMESDIVKRYAKLADKHITQYVLLRNSRSGKPKASNAGNVGVLEPVTRNHYIEYFCNFELVGIDSAVYGEQVLDPQSDTLASIFESEVMLFKRAQTGRLHFLSE